MSKDLEISSTTERDVHIIHLLGDVTAVTGQAVEDAYREASGEGPKRSSSPSIRTTTSTAAASPSSSALPPRAGARNR